MGTNAPAYGSIEPVVNETGHVSLSVDGLAENTGSGTIRVNKPAGAAVRKAFMAAASSGYSGYQIPNGGVTIDGQAVTWEMATPSSILSWNHWADVTSLVKSKIDTAPAGIVTFTVGEQNTDSIDGEILAVIFDDPNQTTNNTVALLFGAQNVAGDSFHIRFADPIDTSDPNLKLDMSLGISFGYQNSVEATGQYSIVNVNGQRLSTSAGG